MSIGERIKARRKELGLEVEEIAVKLGKSRATVYRYESDDVENMPLAALVPLAEVLQVTPAYLMGWEGDSPTATLTTKRVPLLGEIAAGVPILAHEDHHTYVEVDGESVVDFCLRVKGDSMTDARINDGDLVFVRQQPCVENGEIAVVLIDDEATLKRFYISGNGVILKPENSKYEPMFFSKEDFREVRVLGKAVLFQSPL